MLKEKIEMKKIGNQLIFPLEFLLSLLFTYVLFRFCIIKNYEGYHSLKHLILMGIFGLAIFGIILYNGKMNKGKLEKIVISFLIPIGMLYLVFMLPSQVPDEQVHLARAYEVSEGIFIGRKDSLSSVPKDFSEKIRPNVGTYKQASQGLAGNTNYQEKKDVRDSAATYPFILYLFSSIGFLIARIFSLNILLGCYLAKLMNFIVFLVAAYYILKMIPFGKMAMTAIMFMPMFLHQATSTSADCLVNIIIMLFVAYLLHLRFKEENVKKSEGVFLVILGMIIGIVKYVYLPILGLALIFIPAKNMSKKYKIILLTTLFVLSIMVAGGYYMFSGTYETAFTNYFATNHVNAGEQIKGMIANPIGYFKTLKFTLSKMSEIYLYQMIGNSLGWLCIGVKNIWITAYLIVMLASCFIEKNKVTLETWQKILGSLIAIGISLLIMTGMYITWTGVGNAIIDGVQGRYFIPVAIIVLLCLCKKDNYIKIKHIEYKLPIVLCLLNLPALSAIYHAFMQ